MIFIRQSKPGVCPCHKPAVAFLIQDGKKIKYSKTPPDTCPSCGKLWSEH